MCIKCGHEFRGLGLAGSPFQNMLTGQWICFRCFGKLAAHEQDKYILI